MYVGNLSYEVTEADMTAVFAEYGSVKRVQLPSDRETGRMRGFGFVEMDSETEADNAMKGLQNKEMEGRALSVSVAREKERRSTSSRW